MVLGMLVVLALSASAEASYALDLQSAAAPSPDETAIRKVIADYARAIENKDLDLFKTVKPNLSPDEEKRARSAFASIQSQVVKITFVSIDMKENLAVVKVTRRDTVNGSIPGSFPQTFTMSKGRSGWVIDEIGR
jgi:asparagine synthetase B (glutamine-hydrolysing)